MNDDVLPCDQREIRCLDDNSLLRRYHRAWAVLMQSLHAREREKAASIFRRSNRELPTRNRSPGTIWRRRA